MLRYSPLLGFCLRHFLLKLTTLAAFAAGSAVIATTADSSAIRQPDARKRFVLDVVHMAVALPQGDPQDRLRVLNSAASVVGPLDRKLARQFAREGAHLEAELANSGEKPAVSILASGHLDCASQAEQTKRGRRAQSCRHHDDLDSGESSGQGSVC